MQQPPSMMPVMPSFPPANITTEQIQKYLNENKKLILAILDNQNLGKLSECAQYQAQLQKNLMYLAAIADAQPQTPTMPSQITTQMAPHPTMQQGGAGPYCMPHHSQAAAAAAMAAQQPGGVFPPKMPMQFTSPPPPASHHLHNQHRQQQQHLHHQQVVAGQMSVRPGWPSNGMQQMMLGPKASLGGVGGSGGGGGALQTKQDAPGMGPGSVDGEGGGTFSKGAEESK